MLRSVFPMVAALILAGGAARAQYHFGASASGAAFFMPQLSEDDGRYYARLDMRYPALSISMLYRGARSSVANLVMELGYGRKEIVGGWSQGGLGAGSSAKGLFKFDMVQFAIAPEFRLDPEGRTAIRIGLALGWVVRDRFTGTHSAYGPNAVAYGEVSNFSIGHGGGELKQFVAIHSELPHKGLWVWSLDPFLSWSLFSGLVSGPRTFDCEIGVVVSLTRLCGKSVTTMNVEGGNTQ